MKAKKIATYRDKHFTTIEYEYRGRHYDVTYPNGWQVCCSPAWVQHRDAQAEIDKQLDNLIESEPIDWDEIFDMITGESK